MKKLYLGLLLLLTINILSSLNSKLSFKDNILEYSNEDYNLQEIKIKGEKFIKIDFEGVFTNKKGFPKLPKQRATLNINSQYDFKYEIISSDYKEIKLDFPIIPSKGIVYRNQDISKISTRYSESAMKNEFYPKSMIELSNPFILRDLRGINLYLYPFQYNYQTKTLRIYTKLEIRIENKSLEEKKIPKKLLSEMNSIYKTVFMNYHPNRFEHEIDEVGSILILYTPRDSEAVLPYIKWKREKGHHVYTEEVEVGTNVEALVKNKYETYNDILYVQLVGDWEDIKSSFSNSNNSPLDPNLGCVAGEDIHPDLIVGRFSGKSSDEITVQIEKSINYEKNAQSSAWYSKGIGIASEQNNGGDSDDNEYDYEHIDIIKENKLLPFTYSEVAEAYEFPSVSDVANPINEGLSIINYAGHGSHNSWSTSGFNCDDITNLSNGSKLPFIWSVACLNGQFHTGEDCFAEAWLKQENGGAVAMYASTISQSWNAPMRGQDYMNDLLIGGYNYDEFPGSGINTDSQKTTFGSLCFNGSILMTLESENDGQPMMETWHIFGDAALQVRTDNPEPIIVSHQTLFENAENLAINTDSPNSLVSLSHEGELIASGVSNENGEIILDFEQDIVDSMNLKLTITAFNKMTYQDEIDVLPAIDPYIHSEIAEIIDEDGNGNADYSEEISLKIRLENIGTFSAEDIDLFLSTEDDNININSDHINLNSLPSGEILVPQETFDIQIADYIEDKHSVPLILDISYGEYSYQTNLELVLHAPILKLTGYVIDDLDGNNNGRLDIGEEAQVKLSLKNSGSSPASDILANMQTSYDNIDITPNENSIAELVPEEIRELSFSVNIESDAQLGDIVDLFVSVESLFDYNTGIDIREFIGRARILIVDLDGNKNSAPILCSSLADLNLSYTYLEEIPGNLNLYEKVFICCGIYPDNYSLSIEDSDKIFEYLQTGGNLYMEGGDLWAYGDQSPAIELFHIIGDEDGQDDLENLSGVAGTFLEAYNFTYNGDNNWIDRISAEADAELILRNETENYGCAVGYSNENYRTIGTSFEFGGLVDGEFSKMDLLEEYLNFMNFSNLFYPVSDLQYELSGVESNNLRISWDLPQPINEEQLVSFSVYKNGIKIVEIPSSQLFYSENNISNGIYEYGVEANYIHGNSTITKISVNVNSDPEELTTVLKGNFPNPFNSSSGTFFRFSIAEEGDAKIRVYNIKGQFVRELRKEDLPISTNHQIFWDGKNRHGKLVSSGVYFYKFKTQNYKKIGKILFVK